MDYGKTKILKCDCYHKVQDQMYGPQNRVHNVGKKKDGGVKFRCTVCKKEK